MKNFISKNKNALVTAGAVVFWILVWHVISLAIDQQLLVPSPVSVAAALFGMLGAAFFYLALGNTLLHIALGFFIAFVSGVALSLPALKFKAVKRLLQPLMTVINSTPVASFIILALLFVGSKHIATLTSFLMVMPIIYTNTLTGMESIDRAQFEAADVFGMTRGERLRYIFLPETMPHILSGSSVGLGISWKAGVAAEVIGITANSLGGRLYDSKVLIDIPSVFAYTVAIIVISFAFEKLFMAAVKLAARLLVENGQ